LINKKYRGIFDDFLIKGGDVSYNIYIKNNIQYYTYKIIYKKRYIYNYQVIRRLENTFNYYSI